MSLLLPEYSEQLKTTHEKATESLGIIKEQNFSFKFESNKKNSLLEDLIKDRLSREQWTMNAPGFKWYHVLVFLNKCGVSSVANVRTFDIDSIKDTCCDNHQFERVKTVIADLKRMSETEGVSTLYAILPFSKSEDIERWLSEDK